MNEINNICGEGCSLPSSSNEMEVLLRQLKREIDTLSNDTTATLLTQNGKIAETCTYIKNNLSNYLRNMFDSMDLSGELDSIISDSVNNNISLLMNRNKSVKDFGAVGDGITDDTQSIQNAIDYCLCNGIGTLYFEDGYYLVSRPIIITQTDRYYNFEIKGMGYPHIIPSLTNFVGDYVMKVTNAGTTLNEFKRYLTIRDIVIGHDGDNSIANCSGLYIEETQYMNIDNIMVRGFKNNGVVLRDVFDSMIHNMRVLNIGDVRGLEPDISSYALVLQGDMDNTNATKFYGLHIENSPLMLKIQSKIRHNQFTDCKFEQTKSNYSEVTPIFIDGRSGENTFTNCQFVKNSNNGTNATNYFISTSEATSYHLSSQFFCLFEGCMFTCGTPAFNSGYWINGDRLTITNCEFNQCGGTDGGLFAFRLQNNNIFKNNRIYVTSNNTNTFRIVGFANFIKDNQITYSNEFIDSGVCLSFADNVSNNVYEGNFLNGTPNNPYAINGEYLGDNKFRNNTGYQIVESNNSSDTEPVLLYGSDILKITSSEESTIYKFRYGYNGQHIKVWFKYGTKTLSHNDNVLVLKNNGQYIPLANEIVEFVNIDNIWYQI